MVGRTSPLCKRYHQNSHLKIFNRLEVAAAFQYFSSMKTKVLFIYFGPQRSRYWRLTKCPQNPISLFSPKYSLKPHFGTFLEIKWKCVLLCRLRVKILSEILSKAPLEPVWKKKQNSFLNRLRVNIFSEMFSKYHFGTKKK